MKRTLAATIFLSSFGLAASARAEDGLSMEVVNRVVEQNDHAVQACGRALPRHADELAILVALTIDADGHVADAASTTRSRAATCVEKVALKMVFPAPGSVHHLQFPFVIVPHR